MEGQWKWCLHSKTKAYCLLISEEELCSASSVSVRHLSLLGLIFFFVSAQAPDIVISDLDRKYKLSPEEFSLVERCAN